MKVSDALRVVAELSAAQWGMFTSAQAAVRGVDRVSLTRLADAKQVIRLAHGVYRDAGAPSEAFESLRATWLSIAPKMLAEQRLTAELAVSTPVCGAAAAELHGIGELRVDHFEFTTPVRRQSQRSELRYRVRELDADDVTISEGLPVTTLERTIADLVQQRHDLSNVAQAVADAAQRALDQRRLIELLGPLAARNGLRRGDGAALWAQLSRLAGIDAESAARAVANSDEFAALVTSQFLRRFNEPITAILAQSPAATVMREPLRATLEPVTSQLAKQFADAVKPARTLPCFEDYARQLAPQIRLYPSIAEIINSAAYKQAMRAPRDA